MKITQGKSNGREEMVARTKLVHVEWQYFILSKMIHSYIGNMIILFVINFKLECESEAINNRSHMLCKLTFQSQRDGLSLLHTTIARQVSDKWSWPCGPKASRRGFKGKGTQRWETLNNKWEGIKFSESRKCLPSVWYQKRWSTVKNWEKKLETNPCFWDSRGSLPVISANE